MPGIPEVKTLYDLLPRGTEGGKQFARLVDLLLFREARRKGEKFTSFSDSAGDFGGLDSFAGDSTGRSGVTGFQYKFYPSPLSSEHRADIKKSLETAKANSGKTRVKKWILVTPQDFTQSATRKDGGDVEWFESLRGQLKLNFEVEHWGHRQLIGLMIETPNICLFYYPELVPEGLIRRKTLRETRQLYDSQMSGEYGEIQFVGMSVYKKDATQGIPFENIYIPLSLVRWGDDPGSVRRVSAHSLVARGAKSIVLGDPGSGKSTMMKFLSLVGQSRLLQNRVSAEPDDRLPIFVTLRRYGDELKSRPDLPLLTHITEQVQADFSIPTADESFFEYYLESGNAILLFDGLDELPTDALKEKVRNRVRSFLRSYPGNSLIVSSRIVGYDAVRFPESDFAHYQVGKLLLPDITRFIREWYAVRIPNEKRRNANADDLIGIIQKPSNQAIRDLAENPLLLAIIALVHRLDATLPDERVVLYEKCTETLLNTWHSYKFAQAESRTRARKIDDQNFARMEAVGYWMQQQSSSPKDRAVVPYGALRDFLADYIRKVERPRDGDPDILAGEFLEFVKERAGLLVEVGDKAFSFIHLTFQEYLAARYIKSESLADGIDAVWGNLRHFCFDARWHEVIRLLAADLPPRAKEMLISHMFQCHGTSPTVNSLKLLGGCLADGIRPVEEHAEIIVRAAIEFAMSAEEGDYLWAVSLVEGWSARHSSNVEVLKAVITGILARCQRRDKLVVLLFALTAGIELDVVLGLSDDKSVEQYRNLFLFLFKGTVSPSLSVLRSLKGLISDRNWALVHDPYYNAVGSALNFLLCSLVPEDLGAQFLASGTLVTLLGNQFYGPFVYFYWHTMSFISGDRTQLKAFSDPSDPLLDLYQRIHDTVKSAFAQASKVAVPEGALLQRRRGQPDLWEQLTSWDAIVSNRMVASDLSDALRKSLDLHPRMPWNIAIERCLLPRVPGRVSLFSAERASALTMRLESRELSPGDEYLAAWYLILHVWKTAASPASCPCGTGVDKLVEASRWCDRPILKFCHYLLDAASNPDFKPPSTKIRDRLLDPLLVSPKLTRGKPSPKAKAAEIEIAVTHDAP